MATITPEPWQQQEGESSQAYAAFVAYRDMGPGRSVVETYRQIEGKPGAQQATGRWNKWAKDYRWAERARAWDNRMGAVRQAAAERAEAEDADQLARARLAWDIGIRQRAEKLARAADVFPPIGPPLDT